MFPAKRIPRDKTIPGLKLTRKRGELVIINHGELVIQVVGIQDNQVILAFNGDSAKYSIVRGEIAHLAKPPTKKEGLN